MQNVPFEGFVLISLLCLSVSSACCCCCWCHPVKPQAASAGTGKNRVTKPSSPLCPPGWRSPAPPSALRWSGWNRKWNRRRRSSACWRSNCATRSGRERTQRTATGSWRRRWRTSSPRWVTWLWDPGLAIFNQRHPRCLTRAHKTLRGTPNEAWKRREEETFEDIRYRILSELKCEKF